MKKIFRVPIFTLLLCLLAVQAYTLDYPHTSVNNIGCNSCHFVYGSEAALLLEGLNYGVNIDDTQYNALCWSCHNDIQAPYQRTHSSLQIDNSYGDWSVECITCHYPHSQKQFRTHGSDSYLTSGISTNITATTLSKTGAGWTSDTYQGLVLIPNVSQEKYGYKITGNTVDTVTVEGAIDLTKANTGDTFAIIYGKLVNSTIEVDEIIGLSKTGDKTVRFFNKTGTNSFADGDVTYDGICEACHTQTTHFRNDGQGPDQLHGNVGSPAGTYCIDCHSHSGGFAHDGGPGVDCDECHGHDSGYGGATGGKGTYETHSTHTENDDTHELKGPNVGCSVCHNTSSYPDFADGVSYADYKTGTLTTVCNTCHSPNGTYDGVSDAAVGAKNNWAAGVYEADGSLTAGKEKWCATCHDETPSQVSSVNAPNVVGDEDGSYTYGTGWGYYKTGHGLSSGSTYPASGGVTSGAGKGCLDCHDADTVHLDGDARTFGCGDGCDSTEYRQGFRLQQVSGQEPMFIPWLQNNSNGATRYRLCTQTGCHDPGPFINSGDTNTNMKTDGVNRHEYHLRMNKVRYPADYNYGGSYNSRINCVVCHNVHGSTRLAMVRDGRLTGREPGLKIWYNNNSIVNYNSSNSTPPDPENLPLSASTGTLWIGNTSGNLCNHCHANGNTVPEYRTPFQNIEQVPTLDWTGETYYQTDGVHPDTAAGGGDFEFRVKYTDSNNDIPVFIELWVDKNDDGDYNDSGEKLVMTGVDTGDTNYIDGKIYTISTTLNYTADSVLNYRFYASDGAVATGAPAMDQTVTVTNNPPTLDWTGETNYGYDGVNPNSGITGSSFVFRAEYTDINNHPPSVIEVWVDENDNGVYEAGEKYSMTAVNSGDTVYTDGKLYTRTLSISYAGDGSIRYRIYASDASDTATGLPTSDSIVSITSGPNSIPTLTWTGASGYSCDGVNPDQGPAGTYFGVKFVFQVKYADTNDNAPSVIEVWLDRNDDGDYNDVNEKETMTEVDINDTNYVDGKLYAKTIAPVYAGDGILSYRFYAVDGTDSASGGPVSDNTISLTSAVNVAKSGGYDYTSIGDAYTNVSSGGTVLVAAGTFSENLNISKIVTIQSVDGASVTTITPTVSRPVSFYSGSGASVLNGFTVTGGSGVTGAGIYISQSQPTITNCIITGNDAGSSADGGGIYVSNSISNPTITNTTVSNNSARKGGGILLNTGVSAVITNSIIDGNSASSVGGGIDFNAVSSSTTVTNTTISNNSSAASGGGVYFNGSAVTFSKSIIKDNTAASDGGAMFLNGSSSAPTFTNCTITGNRAGRGGAAYGNTSTSPVFTNCSIVDNTATQYGGVFYVNAATIVARNTIIWGNTADTGGHISYFNNGSLTIADSIAVQGGKYNGGNIVPVYQGYTSDEDPLLDSGYYLTSGSASVIDHANAAYAPLDDIDGDSRPEGSGDDIGSDEYVSPNNIPSIIWTGETNFMSDGVNPDSAAGGTDFEFRIDYADADNTAPSSIQVWVDIDDSGTYECSEKYDLTETTPGDTSYANGKLYARTLAIYYAGDGSLNYRFHASDGTVDASGIATLNKTVTIINNTPTLAWTGEAGYTSDGVNPDSAAGGSSFEFRTDYTDIDNTAPVSIQIWIDEDDSGVFDTNEKYDMTEVTSGDSDYTDGKFYTKTLTISYAGDGALNYRFYASDGTDSAAGTPISNSTISLTNSAPVLAWTGEANYTGDGVNPNSAANGSNFEFRIDYTDANNDAPAALQLWIDEDDSGVYDANEKYDMTEVSPADTVYSDGKLYVKTLAIAYAGDGNLNYRFYASDGNAAATGTPASNSIVTVTSASNNAPVLAWTGEANYTTDGVNPDSGAGSFEFRIDYSDFDDEAPATIEVWVDEDDSGTYSVGEKYAMTAVDSGDTLYTDGKLYTKTLALSYAGDGSLNYTFYATDGASDATGAPASNSAVTVVDTLDVPVEYATIQAAVNAASNGNIILVSDGTYSENINYGGKNITIQSVNGAGSTTIQGSGANAAVITFSTSETSGAVLDGFTIDNQAASSATRGIYISGATPTIQNSIIQGNSASNGSGGGGVYITNSAPSFDNVTIRANWADNRNGCGMYITGAAGGATITNSTIGGTASGDGNTCTNGEGGGIYYTGSTTGTLSISGSNIQYNHGNNNGGGIFLSTITNTTVISNSTILDNFTEISNTGYGGGIYAYNAPLSITGGSIISNTSGVNRGGGGLYLYSTTGTATTITGTTINSNSTGSVGGGGIYTSGDTVLPTLDLSKVKIQGNAATAGGGGGIRIVAGTATITNTLITGNRTVNDWIYGGGIKNAGTLNLYFSTVSNNYAHQGGGLDCAGTETVRNSIIYNNAVTQGDVEVRGTLDTDDNNVTSGSVNFVTAGTKATSAAAYTDGSFLLDTGSICIDTGNTNNAPSDDIDGNTRPTDIGGYGDGTDDYDIGAYEKQ